MTIDSLSPAEKFRLILHLDSDAAIRGIPGQYVLNALVVLRDGVLDSWLSKQASDPDAAIEAWWAAAITSAKPWAYLEAQDAAWVHEPAQRTWRRLAPWEIDDRDKWRAAAIRTCLCVHHPPDSSRATGINEAMRSGVSFSFGAPSGHYFRRLIRQIFEKTWRHIR